MTTPLSNSDIIDTRFRAALQRMAEAGRLKTYDRPADTHLEIAAIMKQLDGGPAVMFTDPTGFKTPVLGNFLSAQANCEAAFGVDFRGIRTFVARAGPADCAADREAGARAGGGADEGLRPADVVARAASHPR